MVERARAHRERLRRERAHRVATDRRGASEIVEHEVAEVGVKVVRNSDGASRVTRGPRGSGLVVSPVVLTEVVAQTVLGAEMAIAASQAVVISSARLAKVVPREHRGHRRSRVAAISDGESLRTVVSQEDRPARSGREERAHGTSGPPSLAMKPSVQVRRGVVGQRLRRPQPAGVRLSPVNVVVGVVEAGADEAVSVRCPGMRVGLRFPSR